MNKNHLLKRVEMAEILLYRLEKISADSPWAHQASGVRASIAKLLSRKNLSSVNSIGKALEKLMALGYEILENAAGEIPEEHQP